MATFPQVQPARYVSQYDPAANELTQRVLQGRNQAFQQSYSALAEEQARMGDIFFLDQEAKRATMQRMNEEKENILQKYEYDYEAAAPELTQLIVNERNRPEYQLNKLQIQKAQEANAIKAKLGNDAIIVDDVANSLYDEQGNLRSAQDFDYNIMQRSDYIGELTKGTQGIARSLEQSGLMNANIEGFLMQKTEQGWDNLSIEDQQKVVSAMGDMLRRDTTFQYDDKYKGIEAEEYAAEVLPWIIGSSTKRNIMADWRDQYAAREETKNQTSTNPLFSTRERGVEINRDTKVFDEYLTSMDQVNRVQQSDGKLDVLTNVAGITQAKYKQTTPGTISSALLDLNKNDKAQFNAWIEAAKLEDPKSVEHFITKDKNGDYMFSGGNDAAGAVKLGKVLSDMYGEDGNYTERVQKKYEKAQAAFREEYGEMYDYLLANNIPEEQIIPMLQQGQGVYQFNDVFDLNADVVAPEIDRGIRATPADNVKLYQVNDDGTISDKAVKKGKDVLAGQKVKSTFVDPQTGTMWLTYEDKQGNSNTYAIKGGEGMLSKTGDRALSNLTSFANSLGSMKIPEEVIKVGKDYGYVMQKDPKTLRPIVKQVRFNKDGKINAISEEIDPSFVYDDLLTQLLRSQGIENKPQPTKF